MIVVLLVASEPNPWDCYIAGPFSSKEQARDWIELDYKKDYDTLDELHWDDNKESCYVYDGNEGGYQIIILPNEPIQ